MGRRHPNHRLVKIHRNYTVEAAATLLGVHRNTVHEWIRRGLPTVDRERPFLILGRCLSDFLVTRRMKNKRPCQPGEIYCVRCRHPRTPSGNMAEYRPVTDATGTLIAICPICECMIYRRVSAKRMKHAVGNLDVTFAAGTDAISRE